MRIAQPIDGAVDTHQGGGSQVADDAVILNGLVPLVAERVLQTLFKRFSIPMAIGFIHNVAPFGRSPVIVVETFLKGKGTPWHYIYI